MSLRDTFRIVANAVLIPLGAVIAFLPRFTDEMMNGAARAFQPFFAAAGWAFSIWGLIYTAQIMYAVYQALPSQRHSALLQRVGASTAANAVLSAQWVVAFSLQLQLAAWVTLLATFAVLVRIEMLMGDEGRRGADYWLVRAPFSLNLGWLAVATLVGTAQFFYIVGYRGELFHPYGWSVFAIGLASVAAIAMVIARKNLPFALAIAWGITGVGSYRAAEAPTFAVFAYVAAAVVVAAVVVEAIGMRLGRITRKAWHVRRPVVIGRLIS